MFPLLWSHLVCPFRYYHGKPCHFSHICNMAWCLHVCICCRSMDTNVSHLARDVLCSPERRLAYLDSDLFCILTRFELDSYLWFPLIKLCNDFGMFELFTWSPYAVKWSIDKIIGFVPLLYLIHHTNPARPYEIRVCNDLLMVVSCHLELPGVLPPYKVEPLTTSEPSSSKAYNVVKM